MVEELVKEFVLQDKKNNFYLAKIVKEAGGYTSGIFKIQKEGENISLFKKIVGIIGWSRINKDCVELEFYLNENVQGLGLGGEMIDFAKEFARSLGYKKAYLNQIRRMIKHREIKDMDIDGNRLLYLKHNFKVCETAPLPYNMVCDLEREERLTLDEKNLEILNNKKVAYLDRRLK